MRLAVDRDGVVRDHRRFVDVAADGRSGSGDAAASASAAGSCLGESGGGRGLGGSLRSGAALGLRGLRRMRQ